MILKKLLPFREVEITIGVHTVNTFEDLFNILNPFEGQVVFILSAEDYYKYTGPNTGWLRMWCEQSNTTTVNVYPQHIYTSNNTNNNYNYNQYGVITGSGNSSIYSQGSFIR